jgi:hypothetical protein
MGFVFWYGIPDIGLEKGGLALARQKKCPEDTFLPAEESYGHGSTGPWTHVHPIHKKAPKKPLV